MNIPEVFPSLVVLPQKNLSLDQAAVSVDGGDLAHLLVAERIANHAREIGATSLFLGSSTKLPTAVHLYESVGFRHVPPSSLPGIHYSRADVFMVMEL